MPFAWEARSAEMDGEKKKNSINSGVNIAWMHFRRMLGDRCFAESAFQHWGNHVYSLGTRTAPRRGEPAEHLPLEAGDWTPCGIPRKNKDFLLTLAR